MPWIQKYLAKECPGFSHLHNVTCHPRALAAGVPARIAPLLLLRPLGLQNLVRATAHISFNIILLPVPLTYAG